MVSCKQFQLAGCECKFQQLAEILLQSQEASIGIAQDENKMFAQLTVRIRARHKFAAYNARGQLVAGSGTAEFPVQDVWIFEHALRKAAYSRWRLAGRLGGLPPAGLALSWRQWASSLIFRKPEGRSSEQQVASA